MDYIIALAIGVILGLMAFYLYVGHNFKTRPTWVLTKLADAGERSPEEFYAFVVREAKLVVDDLRSRGERVQ